MTEETLKKQDKTQSILVIVVGFLVLHLLFKYYFKKEGVANYLLYFSAGVGVLSLLSTTFQNAVLWVWFKIALILGYINTRLILGLVFFVFLTPFAWMQKLFVRKNFLSLKDKESTVYHTRNHQYKPEDFDNIW